ncbi:hypothetical protein C8Q80DRAFT_1117844 [Daedaleopsis nitida]|nr:hypothetical protein C8Q80DRAFT_1117844 [Daedaleopsis nitida]
MSNNTATDPTVCEGKAGCGNVFSNKTQGGLCARCEVVSADEAAGRHDHIETIMTYPQCQDCGAYGKMFQNHLCGRCRNLRHGREQIHDQAAREMHDTRANPLPQRITANGPARQPAQTPSHILSATSVYGSAPGPIRPGAPVPKPSQFVWLEPKFSNRNKELEAGLGPLMRSWSPETLMDGLDQWNKEPWEEIAEKSLDRDSTDVDIRWHNNILPEPGTVYETVGDFYDAHNNLPTRDLYFGKVPVATKHTKGQSIHLEILINIHKFEKRTESAAPAHVVKGAGKRKAPSSGHRWDSGAPRPADKRARTVMKSTFVPQSAWGLPPAITSGPYGRVGGPYAQLQDVHLLLANIVVDAVTGAVNVSWDVADGAEERLGRIADQVDSQGKTKKVFLAELGEGDHVEQVVAKRFFEIGKGADKVSCAENAHYIELEARRLALGKFFFDLFLTGNDGPSKASGLAGEWSTLTSAGRPKPAVVWLLEPRRTKTVKRWSGTLVHTSQSDKKHSTMGAFVHFTYEWSKHSIMFADLQSSIGRLPGPHLEYGNILFDVMTHTPAGESGIGDHGLEGMATFVKDHHCFKVCDELDLQELVLPDPQPQPAARRQAEGDQSDNEDDTEEDGLGPRLVAMAAERDGAVDISGIQKAIRWYPPVFDIRVEAVPIPHFCRIGFTCRCIHSCLFGIPTLPGGQAQYMHIPKAGGTLFNLTRCSSSWTSFRQTDGESVPGGPIAQGQASVALQDSDRALTIAVIGLGPVGVVRSLQALLRVMEPDLPVVRDSPTVSLLRVDILAGVGSSQGLVYQVIAIDPLGSQRQKMEAVYRAIDASGKGSGRFAVASVEDGKLLASEWTQGAGSDALLEVRRVSSQSRVMWSEATAQLTLAYNLVHPFGIISSVGVHQAPPLPFTSSDVYNKNMLFDFGWCPVWAMFPIALEILLKQQDMFASGGGEEASLIDRIATFNEAVTVYEEFDKGKCGKILFDPWR